MSKGRFDFVTIVWPRVTRRWGVRAMSVAMRGSLPVNYRGRRNEIS